MKHVALGTSLLFGILGVAWLSSTTPAQTPVFCPTRPPGDNTNACASTAFVLANAGGGITQLTGDVTAGPGSGSQAATLAWISRAASKTLTINNSLTFAGTDATTMTFPSTNGTIAALNIADQTVSGGANVTSQSLSTGNITIDCGGRPLQFQTNGGAFTITAPANDGSCILLSTNNASAGAITFSGFSVGTNTGDALDTTNAHKFSITIWRINGTSGYRVAAHQ